MWALQCGCASRRELYARLTWRELRELEIAYDVEPWGETRADLRAGIIATAAVSPHVKRGSQPRPIDFMPFVERPRTEPVKTLNQMKSIVGQIKAAFEKGKQNG